MKLLKCKKCDRLFMLLREGNVDLLDGHLEEIKANSKDAALEKHVPAVTVKSDRVEVVVGEVVHPMLEEHFITEIFLVTDLSTHIRHLKPGQEPKAVFMLAEGEKPVAVYEYCNLHGLWVKEL
jgi:superoxide reductase